MDGWPFRTDSEQQESDEQQGENAQKHGRGRRKDGSVPSAFAHLHTVPEANRCCPLLLPLFFGNAIAKLEEQRGGGGLGSLLVGQAGAKIGAGHLLAPLVLLDALSESNRRRHTPRRHSLQERADSCPNVRIGWRAFVGGLATFCVCGTKTWA